MRSIISFIICLGAIFSSASCSNDSGSKDNSNAFSLSSPYKGYENWYKGECHCHSENSSFFAGGWQSDPCPVLEEFTHGESQEAYNTPVELAAAYADAGYDFMFLTDHETATTGTINHSVTHNTTSAPIESATVVRNYVYPDHVDGASKTILCFTGEEVGTYGDFFTHGNAFNITSTIKGDFNFSDGVPWSDVETLRTRQYAIDETVKQGGFMQLNHPRRYPYSREFVDSLNNLWGIEVYNAGSGAAVDVWDEQISQGKKIWGNSGDDAHGADDIGGSFIMVNSPDKTKDSIINNMYAGNFNFCMGGAPEFTVMLNGKTIAITVPDAIEGEYDVEIIWYRENMERIKRTLGSEDSYTADGSETFVRAEVLADHGEVAWSQPIFIVK